MKPATHPTALRIQQLLVEAGLQSQVLEFEQPTRTSAEAAAAVGCTVAQIAKSVVFRNQITNEAVLVVASGVNRVCEGKLAKLVGASLARADADFVLTSTGFVIGGVSPVGHTAAVAMFLDMDLQRFETIWVPQAPRSRYFHCAPPNWQNLPAHPGAISGSMHLDIRSHHKDG